MKIIATSDLHGDLPVIIEECDVVIIPGDISPLYIQRNYSAMCDWLNSTFLDWVENLACKRVILIAGNHDFLFENPNWRLDCEQLLNNSKLIYLENEYYEFEGVSFYGCPCSEIPGWAFSAYSNPSAFHNIEPDIDVLVVHQAPNVGKVGVSFIGTPYEENWGSTELKEIISERNPRYVFCGHIHSGCHDMTLLNNTRIYNVSLKDEDYIVQYDPLVIDI